MTQFIVTAVNAGGARSEIIGTFDTAREALRAAAKQGRKAMEAMFGPKDYRFGELWTVDVHVAEDLCGQTWGAGERPLIYSKLIPARRIRG